VLPLGGNAIRRSLGAETLGVVSKALRDSIRHALDHREQALEYAMQFARDMEPRLAEKFVGMYVNHYTLDAGDVIPKAAQKLFDMGHEVGLIPNRIKVEFVR
jgi:1,4-dihydroxy-6-naphthoate synthase